MKLSVYLQARKCLDEREILTKPSKFNVEDMINLTAQENDAENKQHGKDYIDDRRNAKSCDIKQDYKVLVQQLKRDKLTT